MKKYCSVMALDDAGGEGGRNKYRSIRWLMRNTSLRAAMFFFNLFSKTKSSRRTRRLLRGTKSPEQRAYGGEACLACVVLRNPHAIGERAMPSVARTARGKKGEQAVERAGK